MTGLLKKAGLGIALAATAITAAAPADAQRLGGYRHYRHGGRGDVAAGALLGGILGLGVGAAIANGNDRYRERDYYYDAPPPPPPVYRGDYYDGYAYSPRCWNQWRWDPYYGRNVRVRVCN